MVQDWLSDVALPADRVDGDDRALDRHHLEQRRDRDDFAGFVSDCDLATDETLAGPEAETIWIGDFAPFVW
jgi:hypothetical protein